MLSSGLESRVAQDRVQLCLDGGVVHVDLSSDAEIPAIASDPAVQTTHQALQLANVGSA